MPLDYPVHRRTLPNGLRVVVSPDHTVPNVTVNLWVGVGSRHEQAGRTGFAHLFEHLMFQGSRNVRSGEHFEALMAEGGRLNATTWFDRTNYFETVPKGALELALWLEADRHGYLLDALTQENLDNQRDVVKEEKRQRYDNQPYGTALIDVYATVFPEGHPYHHPTIGSMEDLDAADLEDVHAFFRRFYAPDNTVLTLCGDIEPEEGFALVERHLGGLDARAQTPRPALPQLEPLTAPVRVERREQVPNDRLHVAFRLPVDGTDELVAATVALDCLGGLSTSRLVRRLVRREQSAVGAHATAWGFVDGVSLGFVVIDAAPDADPADLEAALLEELERLAADGPTEAELEASIAQSERAWLSALASQEERADLLSRYTLLHDDPEIVNTHLDTVRAVTAERVMEATRRWLRPESRAVVAYLDAADDAESTEAVA
ncbi:pitrilysin family protein [Arthrobacter sp. NEB 688]|uniref:M16 family metallopeptidase n=1 Tax=Arthrobacter sp. NEB 688 TaxID=904039 RepID=UPI001567BE89|nr:pitrilysin family protein [Arthrobacter sp. NEB 688]QKE84040.1 insulinase family protein [Arthrobacter sp. NEB 688]